MRTRSFFLALLLCLNGLFAGASQAQDYQVSTLATGLDKPWSITSIGEGTFLVTEKSGRLVRLDADGNVTTIEGTPPSILLIRADSSRYWPTRTSPTTN